jgi:hypothetical protein
VVPAAEHVHTTSTTVVDGPSPTPTTTTQVHGEAAVERGGSIKARTSPVSSSSRRSFEDHRRHEWTYYTLERSKQFSFRSCCICFHL